MAFRVKIEGPGLTFDTEIDAAVASRIIQMCLVPGALQQIGQVASSPDTSLPSYSPEHREVSGDSGQKLSQISPAEFFGKFSANSNSEKILVFAEYVTKKSGKESFEPAELKALFQKVGEPVPKNYSRDFRLVEISGWVAECIDSDEYYITTSGRKILNSNFNPEVVRATKKSEVKPRRKITKDNKENSMDAGE